MTLRGIQALIVTGVAVGKQTIDAIDERGQIMNIFYTELHRLRQRQRSYFYPVSRSSILIDDKLESIGGKDVQVACNYGLFAGEVSRGSGTIRVCLCSVVDLRSFSNLQHCQNS